MSTQIFLGPPPPHVEAWIKEHYKVPEKWVSAVYTDKWGFSNGKNYNLKYTWANGETGTFMCWNLMEGDSVMMTFAAETDENATQFLMEGVGDDTGSPTARRVYTPGHWEDADGNWINGNWTSNMNAFYNPYGAWDCNWIEKGNYINSDDIADESGWYFNS